MRCAGIAYFTYSAGLQLLWFLGKSGFKKLSKLLDQSNFFFNLTNKGNYKNYVDNVPIYLSMDECNGLKGSAICFKNKYFTKSRTVYNI